MWEIDWVHAGGADTEFQHRWPENKKVWLPFLVTHLGTPFQNWYGRSNQNAMKAMLEERSRSGVIGKDERTK